MQKRHNRPMKKLLIASLLALALVGLQSSSALATDTNCVGTLAAPATVQGDLVVRPGTFCIILGVVVYGNVKVMPGAIGFHAHGSYIHGSVDSPGPLGLDPVSGALADIRILFGTTVGGNVLVARTLQGSYGGICDSSIGGDVVYKQNRGSNNIGLAFFDCTDGNTIHGSVILQDNFIPDGGMTVELNQITGDLVLDGNTAAALVVTGNHVGNTLKCQNNTPPPTNLGNTARHKEGQCTAP